MTLSLLLAYGSWGCFAAASAGRLARRKWLDKVAAWLAAIGFGLLSGGLVSRGLEVGHWPLVGRYEFTLGFAWATVLVHMILEWRFDARAAGAVGQPIAFILMGYALLIVPASSRAVRPIPPALQSPWLIIHGVSTAVAYGAFAVAAGLGLHQLLLHRYPDEADSESPNDSESHAWRAAGIGFTLLSAGILSGAIWAQNAWGSYWSWDPKETWALITWLVYLLYLHARGLRGWRGGRAAWLVVVAFGFVLFTFLGVNWLVRQLQLESLHVF
jgi:cytochrome c-type biogenesis protein CcsB